MDGRAYRGPSILIRPIMQTTPTPFPAEVQPALDRYKAVCAEFERARDEAARIDADLQKHRKAAEAADAEAQQARADAAQLMRNTGSSMKDIHALKAKERAAYTLAEDYRAIVAEFQAAHDEAVTDAGIAKRQLGDAYGALLHTYADTLMAQAAQLVTPLFPALAVQQMANTNAAASPGGADWEYFSTSAGKAALDTLSDVIERSFRGWKFHRASDPVLQAVECPTGLDRFKVVSVAAQHRDDVLRQQAALSQPA